METIDIPAIERHARQLRAQEMQRLHNLFGERARLYALLAGSSLLSLLEGTSELLRPLFSWNPQAAPSRTARPPLHFRVRKAAGDFLAWHPRKGHSC